MTIPDEKFYRAQITQRVDFAPDLWMFRIRSGGEFKFVPGQYATLGVEAKGKRVERPYSIASAPSENEVEFFFELVDALAHHKFLILECRERRFPHLSIDDWRRERYSLPVLKRGTDFLLGLRRRRHHGMLCHKLLCVP